MQTRNTRRGRGNRRFNDPLLRHLVIPQKTANPDLASTSATKTANRYAVRTLACQTVMDKTAGLVQTIISKE
ncbi:MAG: hypothetical protein OXH90_02955 [Paracoccaceae bacterium]|nr:hypothetical protein [Paracoccaceae bacterium]